MTSSRSQENNWSLAEHITDHLHRPRMGDTKHPTLWPSEASAVITNDYDEEVVVGKCRRATFFRYSVENYKFYDEYEYLKPLVLDLQQQRIPHDRYLKWLFAIGNLYEDYIIDQAKASGVYIADQVRIYIKEYNVSGKIDVTTIDPVSHKYINTEIKSVYGYGGNFVMGKPHQRRKGQLGEPRDSNLMQVALYEWWNASEDDRYDYSHLLYGGRDTGRFAEYRIITEEDPETGLIHIYYEGVAPNQTSRTQSPITINSILHDGYNYVQQHVDAGKIPPRDYDLQYSQEKIKTLYERDELNKTDTKRYEKHKKRVETNQQLEAEGKKTKRSIKPVEKGDWQCDKCEWKNICYDQDGNPKELEYDV